MEKAFHGWGTVYLVSTQIHNEAGRSGDGWTKQGGQFISTMKQISRDLLVSDNCLDNGD